MSRGAHAASHRTPRRPKPTRVAGRNAPASFTGPETPAASAAPASASMSADASRPRCRLTFHGALRAELCKARSLKSTYVLLIVNAILLPAGAALLAWATAFVMSIDPETGEFTDQQPVTESFMWSTVSAFVPTCMIVTGILGVMAVTVEYSSSTIQSSLVANPRRVMFMNAKTLVTAALAFISSLVGLLLAWAVSYALLSGGGLTPLADGERILPWVSMLGGAALLTATSVMAVGFGGICRSTMGGVFSLVGLLMIVPSVLSMASLAGDRFAWVQSLARCLPDQAASNFLTAGVDAAISPSSATVSVNAGADAVAATTTPTADPGGLFDPTWWQSGLILLLWAMAVYAVGVLIVRRADVK